MLGFRSSHGAVRSPQYLRMLGILVFATGISFSAQAATIEIKNQVAGTTPAAIGYNLSYFYPDSNAEDWWRYSGVKAVRIFMSNTNMEPEDDNGNHGDGVDSKNKFEKKKAALRAMGDAGTKYVKWKKFQDNIKAMGSNFTAGHAMDRLRGMGVEILATISATRTRFPLESNTEYANMWELWQHYYAVTFILARDYDVRRYTIYNEPDLTNTVTPTNWQLRLRVAGDAIRAAVADVNSRHGKSLATEIMAPNTAQHSYADGPGTYQWGRTAVLGRHVDMWDKSSPGFRNFDIYNYQKYTHRQFRSDGFDGYTEDCQEVKAGMAADMGSETPFPLALTEMNTRASDGYDSVTNHPDTPFDFAALGASGVALISHCQAAQLYLFKFGMSIQDDVGSNYPVTKNGAHHADFTGDSPLFNYGTAAGSGEVWRLFARAAGVSRNWYSYVNPFTRDVWTLATRDAAVGVTYLFVANKTASNIQIGFNLSAFGVPNHSLVTVAEVSANARGAVKRVTQPHNGVIAESNMPANSVWLVSIYEGAAPAPMTYVSADNAVLGDGAGKNATGANASELVARANSAASDRKVGLLKFNLLPELASHDRILLRLHVRQTASSVSPTHSHVYGIEYDGWSSATATWANMGKVLKQDVPAGNRIVNNVVNKPGQTAKIQGQLVASSTTPTFVYIDVTDFVKAQTNGKATFLVAQEHRWNYNLDTKTWGDSQAAGIAVDMSAEAPVLLYY